MTASDGPSWGRGWEGGGEETEDSMIYCSAGPAPTAGCFMQTESVCHSCVRLMCGACGHWCIAVI